MSELTLEPAEAVRARLERALASEEVNLASEVGRGRTEELIEETLRSYEAEALSGQAAQLDPEHRVAIAAELRNELIGLGAIAERMLADPVAQEWMINGPKRVFRDTGERIERVPELVFDDDRQVRAFVERLLEQVEGKRLDRITPRVEARLPDGILVGECRGPETMAMLWSFATGHAGMTSVHGESADHALRNVVRFALTSGARIEA